jgi:deoxyribodipyrimidine photo-lyase
VSQRVLTFILSLAANIPTLQVFTGEWNELQSLLPPGTAVHFKAHPAFPHYRGVAEQRSWLFPDVNGYYPSFSAYWKKCRLHLSALKSAAVKE